MWHDLILAVIQGCTEFLPVSSSAHLVFIPQLFGWEDQGLDYDIVLHLGTLTAVLLYFRKDLIKLSNPFYNLTQNIIIATIPVCIIGFIFKPYIELYLRSTTVIAIATIIFGILLGYSQSKEIPIEKNNIKNLDQISYKHALIIGLFQCLALINGTSRSGITITAALLLSLPRHIAAEFSFLLSIPVILLSSMLAIKDIIAKPGLVDINFEAYILGFTISSLVALTSMKLFIKLLDKIGLMPFVIYRVILGIILLSILYL